MGALSLLKSLVARCLRLPVLWGLLLLSQGGCFIFISRASERQARYLAYEATSLRPHDISSDVEKALRSDLRAPVFGDARYQADLRIFAIRIAARYVSKDPNTAPAGFTLEDVERYYREGQALTKRLPGQGVRLIQAQALYFNAAGKSGQALKELTDLMKALLNQTEGGTFFRITTQDALAIVYEGMGLLDQRDKARLEALEGAGTYFAHGHHEEQEYREYHDLLLHRMADLAQRPPDETVANRSGTTAPLAAEVLRLWETARPLAEDHVPLPVRYLSYYRSAEYLAEAGDPRLGLSLIQKWQDQLEEHQGTRALDEAEALEGNCFLGRIFLAMGEDKKARWYLESCLNHLKGVEQREPLLHQALGLLYERQGEFGKAEVEYRQDEEYIERLRRSYGPEQRAAFFNSRVRASYWGLIRSTIRQNEGRALDDAACGKLLAYSEWIRARQLTELVEERQCGQPAPAEGPAERIDLVSLRRGLPVGAVLLDYIVMDRVLALMAVSGSQCRGLLIPLDAGFTGGLKKLSEELGHPTRPIGVLEEELGKLGKQVLGPIRVLMQGARELVVLPDGPLNLIPFDLLSVDHGPGQYRALIEEHVVRLWPSLRVPSCLPRPERRKGRLLAVADPIYKHFQRLEDTLNEVDSIAVLFHGDAKILRREQALGSTLVRGDWRAYTHVHMATHGILGQGPLAGLNEPALVLSVEPAGSQEDSYLRASQASQLKLDADLTVLSACQTGAGRYETGEGVLGLGRAFLIAGSRAVLMSLWEVDSHATVLLMKEFYHHLLQDQDDPAVALRKAKLSLRDLPRDAPGDRPAAASSCRSGPATRGSCATLGHPAYWAGFVLLSAQGTR